MRLPGGGTISARVIGSGDRVRLRGQDFVTGESQPVFDFRSDFHRVDVVVRKRLGPWRFMVSPAFRYQVGRSDLPQQMAEQYRRDYVTSLRAEGVRTPALRQRSIRNGQRFQKKYQGLLWYNQQQLACLWNRNCSVCG